MSLMPASNTVTPPSSAMKYTFIVLDGKPPRTTHTPSAIGSGPVPCTQFWTFVRRLAAFVSRVSADDPAAGSIPSWRARSPVSM